MKGRPLQLIPVDDAYVVEKVATGFRRLVDDEKVVAIAGFNQSSGIDALTEQVREVRVPVIGSQSGSETALKNPYFWNTIATYCDMSKVVLARLSQRTAGGYPKLKVIPVALSVASGEQWVDCVKRRASAVGATPLEPVRLASSITDATAQALVVKQMVERDGANAIALHGTINQFLVFFRALDRAGVYLPIGAMSGGVHEELYRQGPQKVTSRFFGVHSFTPSVVQAAPGNKEMVAFVRGTNWEKQARESISFVQGWVNGKVITAALNRVSGTVSRSSIQAALGKLPPLDTGRQSGPIDFRRAGHNGGALVRPYVWRYGKLIPDGAFTDWERFTK